MVPRRLIPRGAGERRLRHRWRVALLALGALGVGACELATEAVPPPARRVVVHAVLNPDADEQVFLVESSLTGRVTVDTARKFDPLDPIRTAGGEPITGARVRLMPDGDSAFTAFETEVDGRPTGRYAIARERLAIRPGRTYRLTITTPDAQVVTGETTVPSAPPDWQAGVNVTPIAVRFDRSGAALELRWDPVPGARTYAIRVETPNGPWFLFSDSTRFALSGALRNFFVGGLPAVWYPGHEQLVSVSAVDRNFYDYNRSGNDPFGGSGLISSVRGGIGLFGSTLAQLRRVVTVTERDRFPLDARWVGVSATGNPVELDLWVESPGSPRASVSGRERLGQRRFVIGTLEGDQLRLVTMLGTSSADTAALFTARLAGGTITGTYDARFEGGGARTFTRQARAAQ
jgi:hypothetical protein